jgi:hypothetical protein
MKHFLLPKENSFNYSLSLRSIELVGVLKYLVLGVFFVFFLFWFWLGWGAIGIFLCVAEGTQGQNNTPYFHPRFLFIYLFIYYYYYYLF